MSEEDQGEGPWGPPFPLYLPPPPSSPTRLLAKFKNLGPVLIYGCKSRNIFRPPLRKRAGFATECEDSIVFLLTSDSFYPTLICQLVLHLSHLHRLLRCLWPQNLLLLFQACQLRYICYFRLVGDYSAFLYLLLLLYSLLFPTDTN